jgi:hypothetical protein
MAQGLYTCTAESALLKKNTAVYGVLVNEKGVVYNKKLNRVL